VRDAQGNVMSVYEHKVDNTVQTLTYTQQEKHIYGSSRVGMDVAEKDMITPTITEQSFYRESGKKQYELSNHLGNVLTVITDKKIPVENINITGEVEYFIVEILSATDYSPFGVLLQNRNFTGEKYRYGFNGMEKDNELKGAGNSYDFGARMYDSRLGRWLSVDPKWKVAPHWSVYQSFKNSPAQNIDIDGEVVQGANEASFNKLQGTVDKLFSNYDALKSLFKQQDGTLQFQSISESDFINAVKDISDPDIRALANGYFEAVNSTITYTFLETHSGKSIAKEEGFDNILNDLNEPDKKAFNSKFGFSNGDIFDRRIETGGERFITQDESQVVILFNEELIASTEWGAGKYGLESSKRNLESVLTRTLIGSMYDVDPFIKQSSDVNIFQAKDKSELKKVYGQIENTTRRVLKLPQFYEYDYKLEKETIMDIIPKELELNIYNANPRNLTIEKVNPKNKE
jgi:RHS repeat-associated protein